MKTQVHSPVAMVRLARALARFVPTPVFRWAALLGLGALTFEPQPAQAAVTEAWVHRYSNVVSNSFDRAAKVVRDAADDIIVTGTSGIDMLTLKYSGADGSVLWQRRSNGSANSGDAAAADDEAYATASAVAVDGGGNVVVTGTSYDSTDQNGVAYSAFYTAKYGGGDGALVWERRYNDGPALYGAALAVAVDSSGNVVVAGYSSHNWARDDAYTVKFAAADGALLWEKRSNNAAPWAVAVDGRGNVVVTGTSEGDYYTAKYAAADGALLWENRYYGGENSFSVARAVAVDDSGNVVVTGHPATLKYAAADGALLWGKRSNNDVPWAVALDGGGNVVVSGGNWETDFFTIKYAATDGALLWEKRYNGPGLDTSDWWFPPIPYSVAVDSSGNVVFTGTSGNGNASRSNFDYYTAKYAAADGALLWEKRYDGPGSSSSFGIAAGVDGSGNVLVAGYSDPGWYAAKYAAADGALLWEKRYNEGGNNIPSAMAVDSSGNVVVTGDPATLKYAAADGALLWEKRYNAPANLGDRASASALAVDGSGNVVVTGQSFSRATPGSRDVYDIYTAKYASADGALLWEKRYNGPAGLDDQGHAVKVDAKGDVIVSGVSATSGSPLVGFVYDRYTAKYASADGTLLWEKRGPSGGGVTAAAIDSSGNMVMTGSSWNGTNTDYYMAKYATADGALLWEKRGIRGYPSAVAVDERGNVVVTGSSNGGAGGSDYYTARYAAADGTLLWEKRYNGPANLDDIAEAVRVDGNGNVVVTGRSASRRLVGGGFINDYYTAKYAAADGALLWEKRYNGPANGDDYPSSLALGPNGMAVVTGSSAGTGSSPPYAGYDYATIVYREDLPPVAIERVLVGVRLRFDGTPGRSHNVERAPAVIGPWSTINTQTAPTSGLLEYLDANSPVGAAFYRTSE